MELNREQRRSMGRRQKLQSAPAFGQCPNHQPNVVVSWRPIYHPDLIDGKRNPMGGRIARYVADRMMCVKCGFISPSISNDIIDADRRDIEEAHAQRRESEKPGSDVEAGKTPEETPPADPPKGKGK